MAFLSPDMPLRQKLTLVIVLTSAIALILTCAALFLQEYMTFRQALVRELETTARMLGKTSIPAIGFQNEDEATEILSALEADPQIIAAAIYNSAGELFAEFSSADTDYPFPIIPPAEGAHLGDGYVSVSSVIFDERSDEIVGTFFLAADFQRMHERMGFYGMVVAIALAGSLSVTFLLSVYFQSLVLRPVRRLASAAEMISTHKDYSVRVPGSSKDELGVLVSAFNRMLDEIQQQDAALRRAKNELEERVHERTVELEQRTVELERSNAELEQFAYVASHDLQEPLRMVSSYTQLLARRYRDKLDTDALEFIDFAVDGSSRMQSLINDLLEYSRVGTRGRELITVDCAAVLRQTLKSLRGAIEESGAEVTWDTLPEIVADERQLGQLFQNLIVNAIKFKREETPRVHITAREEENEWVFGFEDNGIGIERKYAECVFDVFERLHGYSEYPGTGIGLAICKKIIERHGGRIWVESEPGRGSVFFFAIPRSLKRTN